MTILVAIELFTRENTTLQYCAEPRNEAMFQEVVYSISIWGINESQIHSHLDSGRLTKFVSKLIN